MKYSSFLVAFFASSVRHYDYALFGLSAGVLSEYFMPHNHYHDRVLQFFAVFSIAVIARPFGALIFGTIGDKYGRSASVKIAAAVASASTIAIGLMPGFDKIGYLSVVGLLICRMIFMLSISGEVDAVKIYIAEKTSTKNKHITNGIVVFCNQVGVLIASLTYFYSQKIVSTVPNLWKLNFIVGGLLGLIVLLLRKSFHESSEFLQAAHKSKSLHKINYSKFSFILAIFLYGSLGGIYHFWIIFFPTFTSKLLHTTTSDFASTINSSSIALYAIISIIAGSFADKKNPEKQIFISLFCSIALGLIAYFINSDSWIYTSIIQVFAIALIPFYSVPIQILLQSIFDVKIRMRMCGISHAIGSMCISATSPFLCTVIWNHTQSVQNVFLMFIAYVVCCFIAAAFLIKQRGKIENRTIKRRFGVK